MKREETDMPYYIVDVFPRIRAGASLKGAGGVDQKKADAMFSPAFVRGPH